MGQKWRVSNLPHIGLCSCLLSTWWKSRHITQDTHSSVRSTWACSEVDLSLSWHSQKPPVSWSCPRSGHTGCGRRPSPHRAPPSGSWADRWLPYRDQLCLHTCVCRYHRHYKVCWHWCLLGGRVSLSSERALLRKWPWSWTLISGSLQWSWMSKGVAGWEC